MRLSVAKDSTGFKPVVLVPVTVAVCLSLPMPVPVYLARRRQPGRALFAAAALPLAIMGALGADEGALLPYGVLGLICVMHAIYPTLLGWWIVVSIYGIFSTIYLFGMIKDLLEMASGGQTAMFLGPADSAFFVILLFALIGIFIGLLRWRPKLGEKKDAGGAPR